MFLQFPCLLSRLWVQAGFTSLCLSGETLGLQGGALNSFVNVAAKSSAKQRLPSKRSLNTGSSRSKVGVLGTWA